MYLLIFRAELVQRLVARQRREDVLELLLERLERRQRQSLVVLLEQPFEAGALALALYINIHRLVWAARRPLVVRGGARLVTRPRRRGGGARGLPCTSWVGR